AKRRQEDDERRKRERDESARRQAEEEARLLAEAESRRRAEEEARRRTPLADGPAEDDSAKVRRPAVGVSALPPRRLTPAPERPTRAKGEEDRRRGKLTLSSATTDGDARSRSLSAMRRRQEKFKRAMHQE